jgi:hypothetical protein
MVNVTKSASRVAIRAETYQLVYDGSDHWRVRLLARNEKPVADLFIASSCDTVAARDECEYLSPPQLRRDLEAVEVIFRGKSTVWQEKEYLFRCGDQEIEYFYRLKGRGRIDQCRFFEGVLRGDAKSVGYGPSFFRHGYRRPYQDYSHGSRPYFEMLYNPEPNARDKTLFRPWEEAVITIRQDPTCHGGNGFLCPAPFCFALSPGSAQEWLTLGLGVRPGEHHFVDYQYLGGEEFGLNLTYQGYTSVTRNWESPHVVLLGAAEENGALQEYVTWLYNRGYLKRTRRTPADWWWEPIFCGRGEQGVVAQSRGGASGGDEAAAAEQCTYENYVDFLATLKSVKVDPGIVIIDAKWMEQAGNPRPNPQRWPDLPGFIARQHQQGRKVLLWLPVWEAEGVPRDECIVDEQGNRIGPDPSNPKYQRRLERRLTEMLKGGENGLDADGFKLDVARPGQFPDRYGGGTHGPFWGTELLFEQMRLINDIAREVKPDALLSAPTVNPYFAEVVDMVRLGSMITDRVSVVDRMRHRARIAQIACPDWLIDADDEDPPGLAAWRQYWHEKTRLGNPSLHHVTRLSLTGEPFTEEDYAMIQRTWEAWRQGGHGPT